MTQALRGADIVARSLERLGCRHVFTLSGNHIMSLFDAAIETKLDLAHVRHEAAAVHMADAWGRLTGEAGVAMVTGGPGHANAVGALFTALGAESPMVLLSGHAATWELGRGGFQEIRQASNRILRIGPAFGLPSADPAPRRNPIPVSETRDETIRHNEVFRFLS